MLRVAFAGTPDFAVPALTALAHSAHRVVGVLTQPDRPAGRGRQVHASAVKSCALAHGLPLSQPARLSSEAERAALRDWAPDLLVVVAYGLILPPAVLQLPRLGCVNIHASLLPRWRGAAPIQRAILAGDEESGVAIMRLEPTLDTGPVYAERRVAIADATAGELEAVLAPLGAGLLLPVIDALERGTAEAVSQPTIGVSYAHKISKSEAAIDWRAPAAYIARQVRAFNPRPVAETSLGAERVRIWRARALSSGARAEAGAVQGLRDDALIVACGDGELAIEQLQLPGRKPVSARDFAHARALAGMRFT
jgi:methionyl-tRNA formyltransferase